MKVKGKSNERDNASTMKHSAKEETIDDPPHAVPQTHALWTDGRP
jgi:hypothetical protein